LAEVRHKAFAMPLNDPAYLPGPCKFYNREFIVISYRTDLEALRAVFPEPLQVIGGTVNYEFIRMPDSTGFGDYTETGQVIPVRFTGADGVEQEGDYVHAMYLDDRSPIAGGREMWGFPKKLASPTISHESETLVCTLRLQSPNPDGFRLFYRRVRPSLSTAPNSPRSRRVGTRSAQRNLFAVEMPKLGSFIASGNWDARAIEAFPPEDRPPVFIAFWTFCLMVGMGFIMLAVSWSGNWIAVVCFPTGFAAVLRLVFIALLSSMPRAGCSQVESEQYPGLQHEGSSQYNRKRSSAGENIVDTQGGLNEEQDSYHPRRGGRNRRNSGGDRVRELRYGSQIRQHGSQLCQIPECPGGHDGYGTRTGL
jgi:acetoacetate decarboxylase